MKTEFKLIEAAADSRPRVAGTAYSGGKMNLPGWRHPVVVELAGMEIPDTVPLLTNHENRTDARVGMVRASVKDGALEIEGDIVSDGEAAKGIVAQSKAGADWQLSIGADVKESELVKADRKVNGQDIEAPFHLVAKSVLREVSVVAVGADSATRMHVNAEFKLTPPEDNAGDNMEKKNTAAAIAGGENAASVKGAENAQAQVLPDLNAIAKNAAAGAVKAERERVTAIADICKGEFPEIEREALNAGWTPEETTAKVLNAIRAARPSANVGISVKSAPDGAELKKTIEAALSLRSGITPEALQKSYSDRTIDAAMRSMDMPLKEVINACLDLEGIAHGRNVDNDSIRAAFSTVSLPGILSNVANKKLLQSYQAQPIIATRLCSTGDLSDFKENDRFRLTDVGDLLPVAPDGEIKEGGLVEESAKNQLDTYGKKFCLTRKMIINDDLGGFMKVPAAMGNRAARLIDQLFFARLLKNPTQGDGKALFSAGHKNLLTGASSALSADSLKKAVQLFLDQVDADNQPISVEPRTLLVPTALKQLAIELTRGATLIMAGGTSQTIRPALNVLADENLEVVSSPYLANSSYEGASATGWYLFGAPGQVDTFEIGYLAGRRTPTVERGETDFNTLGLWFRVYFDVGVREQDHRGMVKANGAA